MEVDQGAYLNASLLIHEHRALTDGNRHPLYPALLAPLAAWLAILFQRESPDLTAGRRRSQER